MLKKNLDIDALSDAKKQQINVSFPSRRLSSVNWGKLFVMKVKVQMLEVFSSVD